MTNRVKKPIVQRLICNTLAQGHAVPSHQRICGACGAGVWVSAAMAPVVDSGEATPICEPCWEQGDIVGLYALHPNQMRNLAELEILDFAYSFVDTMNTRKQGDNVDRGKRKCTKGI